MARLSVKDVLAELEPLTSQLDPGEVITESHQDYGLHVMPFSSKKDLRPSVVLIPSQTESLAKIIKFLYKSGLDFHIRGQGFNSPSARDVLISLLRFTSFEYNSDKKLATIGTGATWIKVAKDMQEADPGFSVAVARTPSVGVGGSLLHGGYSWMTSEFGCISDPINFIDAEIVKYDGSIVMASTEPELLWALRGSGGGFGIMTKAVLRAHPYSTAIWSGVILLPQFLLPTILDEHQLQSVNGDMVALHVYDGCGESHGREVFHWALQMPGAIDRTVVTDMKGIVDMQHNVTTLRSTMSTFRALPLGLADLDEDTIVRTIEWHDEIRNVDAGIQSVTMTVIELLVFSAPIGGQSEVAWPRPLDARHYILLLTGCPTGGSEEQEEKARQLILNAPKEILQGREFVVLPPGLDDLQDPKKSYSQHWDKLVELRKRYDPDLKFKAIVNP
ncbi:hypothetical protein ACJZ2D_004782 [Fusarium nematophilum]